MARDNWFRNTTWNADIEAEFRLRLRRARDKSQYLRIQAGHLAKDYPRVALDLLDEYFALGDDFDMATAYVVQAVALVVLGNVEGALSSYEAALERESRFRHLKTQAYLEYATLVVEARITRLYGRALEVLETNSDSLMFPADRYRANGIRALLLKEFGRMREAREAAKVAMAAAAETRSGFRYHQNLGLVTRTDDAFGKRVAMLAA